VRLLAGVYQPTPLAAVLAALAWKTLLTQLKRLSVHPEQKQQGHESHPGRYSCDRHTAGFSA